MSTLYNDVLRFSGGYRHFNSRVDRFYDDFSNFKICSVNNHSLDLVRFGDDDRITRFIRDPRDLVVSGYFYHRRNAESWCGILNPKEEDWRVVNGSIPNKMGKGYSFSSYLQSVSKEEGLIAEIDFRRRHFESMTQWPVDDTRIKVFRYEDLLGNESAVFAEMFSHYGESWLARKLGRFLADRYSMRKQSNRTKHIRDPKTGQWKEHFTPRVNNYFMQRHRNVLETYGYV